MRAAVNGPAFETYDGVDKISRVNTACEAGPGNVRVTFCFVQIAPSDARFEDTYWFENTLRIFRPNNDEISSAIPLGQPSPAGRVQRAVWSQTAGFQLPM